MFYNSVRGTNFTVERLSEPRFLIRPENGWRVAKVTLNGEDVTAQLMSGYLTLPAVYEDKTIAVETGCCSAGYGQHARYQRHDHG